MGTIISKIKEWNRKRLDKKRGNPTKEEQKEQEPFVTVVNEDTQGENNSLLSSYVEQLGSNSFCSNILGSDMNKLVL
jgi:hypothetical protein